VKKTCFICGLQDNVWYVFQIAVSRLNPTGSAFCPQDIQAGGLKP